MSGLDVILSVVILTKNQCYYLIILNPLIMCMTIFFVMKDKYDILKNSARVKNKGFHNESEKF
jgi:hypothetical protein